MTLIDGTSGSMPARMCGFSSRSFRYAQPQRAWRLGRRHYFGWVLKAAEVISARPGSARCGFAQPILNLTGRRSYTDERFGLLSIAVGATSRTGSQRLKPREELQSSCAGYNLGNPCAEKVRPHRARQNKGAAPLTKAHSAFRRIGGAVRQGTLTITGSNVRLGTEMPVALSYF
jgi:hypothetical protein